MSLVNRVIFAKTMKKRSVSISTSKLINMMIHDAVKKKQQSHHISVMVFNVSHELSDMMCIAYLSLSRARYV